MRGAIFMEIKIIGKELKVTEAIKNQVDKLLSISYHSAKEETIKKLVYLMKNIKKSSTSCATFINCKQTY